MTISQNAGKNSNVFAGRQRQDVLRRKWKDNGLLLDLASQWTQPPLNRLNSIPTPPDSDANKIMGAGEESAESDLMSSKRNSL